MKKLVLIITCLLTVNMILFADNDKTIQFNELPENAQNFIRNHFDQTSIANIQLDKGWFDTEYEVNFTNGSKIEFDENGDWEKINLKNSSIPEQAIPSQIGDFVRNNHNQQKIIEIEKKRYGYEIKLDNGLEITFDKQFNVTDYDN